VSDKNALRLFLGHWSDQSRLAQRALDDATELVWSTLNEARKAGVSYRELAKWTTSIRTGDPEASAEELRKATWRIKEGLSRRFPPK
jgi:hypothetical protein